MLGQSANLTQAVFVYLCICICVFACQTPGNIVLRSSCYYLFKMSHVRSIFKFYPNCSCVFVYLDVRHSGTLFLRSSYHLVFKNISHHGSFQGFHGRELCGANKWMGWVGSDGLLCVGLLHEHRFAVLITVFHLFVNSYKLS